jgi:hypothetical protein
MPTGNRLVDLQHAVIVNMEASTAVHQAEVTAAKRMIERAHDCLDLWLERLIADTGYDLVEMLNWLVHERGIEPHIAVFPMSKVVDGTFLREDFTDDHDSDTYHCSPGKIPQHYRRRFTSRWPRVERQFDPLSRQYTRLRAMPAETTPLSQCPARKVP